MRLDSAAAAERHHAVGRVEIINDDPKSYVFSNIFEVASRAKPYEKVAVGKNIEYVIEAIRAEGVSAWRAPGQDEFALVMDGDEAIAWCEYGSPAELPGIYHRRQYDAGETNPAPWRITCFFVDRDHRRSGVARVALDGALALIAQAGGGEDQQPPAPHTPSPIARSATRCSSSTATARSRSIAKKLVLSSFTLSSSRADSASFGSWRSSSPLT